LSHICSRWRAISLATPSLWSRIAINYSLSPYSSSLAEKQLQRSQKLKIHFYGSDQVDSGPQVHMFRPLSQQSSRWEELSIGLTPEIAPLINSLRDRVPLLKRLWIQWNSPED
ncbi:hypothetical protein B0H13DRAFT_1654696, partial [Mycena leptocephala]